MQECIKIWRSNGFTLRLYDYGHRERISYRFSDRRSVIFEGRDFRPSPLHAWDSLSTVYALLTFLSLRPGDTDTEYFHSYTPEQMEWCISGRAEELSLLVCKWEERLEKRQKA